MMAFKLACFRVLVLLAVAAAPLTARAQDAGYGLEALVGKERWVSRHWGLGIAAQLILATGVRDETDGRIGRSGEGANFLFSATYL